MKRLFDRFSLNTAGRQGEAPAQAKADDEGYFATQFMERPEISKASSAWTARGLAVGAHALDPEVGLNLLLKAWGKDVLMASLQADDHRKLIDHLDFVTVPPGRELIVQEEKGDYALIVLEGLVAVDRVQPTGARARLAEAREGDVLGEMSLLDAGARFATPLLLASPLVLTWMHTCSGGRCAGRCSLRRWAIFSRSMVCTQSKASATTRVLLLCSGPIMCHSI